jgi:serine/threonine-protein kinase HipA
MASLLWGNIYFKDLYAGRLQQEPGNRYSFTYDVDYINAGNSQIAYTLPISEKPIISENGLPPFFDNLVAEGWFKNAQAKVLGVDPNDSFALLLGFGYDLAGAVSIIDPDPIPRRNLSHEDKVTKAALIGRASLPGVQRKLLLVQEGKSYRPVKYNELSTHIAKLPSDNLAELIELEFITTLVVSKLLHDDSVVEMEIVDNIDSIKERALVIRRFDRRPSGEKIHFEEFNQLLGHRSFDKYKGSYEDMAQFIYGNPNCIISDVYKLFRRVLVCLLVGNTDAHLKNFAMLYSRDGLRLTPSYDQLGAAFYKQYQSIALKINGVEDFKIGKLLPKHILRLGRDFDFNEKVIITAVEDIGKNLNKALEAIENSNVGSKELKNRVIEIMEKRWNGTFTLIGQLLLKKQNKDAKNKL